MCWKLLESRDHRCCRAKKGEIPSSPTKVGVTPEKGARGDCWCCRERGREWSGCVCVRAHGSLRLRTERDSSKCDQCQRDLEGGRRRATGVRVTAARRVLAPSQGGGERCLRVRLGPARQRAGPVSLCCSQEPGSWHLPGTAPRQFTGQKRRLQPEASCCTAAGSSQLSTPFFLVLLGSVSVLIWGNRCPDLCLFCCHGPGSTSRQSTG